jgi:hypothetical protein
MGDCLDATPPSGKPHQLAHAATHHPPIGLTAPSLLLLVLLPAGCATNPSGWTRKEPWANNNLGLNWTPKAENYNGRCVR